MTASPTRRWTWPWIKAVLRKYYPAGLVLLLLGAVVQCSIERKNSRIAAQQSQDLSRVSEFLQSGADVDRKVAQLNDALAEGGDARAERLAFREALGKHASIAMSLEPRFGAEATRSYMSELNRLSTTVEGTKSAESPGPIITQMSTVIVSRRALAARAEERI